MAREFFLICDGCDKRARVAAADGMANGGEFLVCTVSINAGGDNKYELCQSCFDRLLEQANPTKWARCASASMVGYINSRNAA
jgi:hypothetical protein